MAIPSEILKKVKQIEIVTKNLVNDIFAGEYHSVFKGRGMEFAEVREYERGDDIRTIDWNVTARMGKPFVKQFMEERELTVMILFDASSSGKFGTRASSKNELAAEVCAILAFSAIRNNDKVGLIIFTDKVEHYLPPKKGKKHILRVIRDLLYFEPEGVTTNIENAITYLDRVVKKRSVIFVVSDFLAQDMETVKKSLSFLRNKHDVIALALNDIRERQIPDVGYIEIADLETGEIIEINTADIKLRENFMQLTQEFALRKKTTFQAANVDYVELMTGEPYINSLLQFFKQRSRKMR